MAEDTNEHLGSSDCSSVFTYDEITALIRSKQKFFETKWGRADSNTADMFMGMHAACGFLIADFAKLSIEKRSERLKLGPSGAKPETM
jgi:hypothetical protein